ncbi:hypothetical protein CUMW_253820 [Citrus unshiu]|uniref:Two-component response regulator-like APRR1 n=1 Tax=Citrus unshiu TaxID=55188 RepID=A0A2H5QR40_CITUN|nr:hypothetical protein CUMW_253820 [Citrus unshiu]
MESKEMNLNKECGGAGIGNSKSSGDGFIDRSKVRILLCDNDSNSSDAVFSLLVKCSYQVTSVRSPRQVIDALNAEGSDIDLILAEVDLPMTKGLKMLKYITRDKELQRIPVISMLDEVSVVVKCLRLGAADYLVKPLRTNELLNLWTHMWRRRRMLGLAEKNILSYDFDLVASDPSDANTNSTTLFSDDTDDKSRRSTNPEIGMSTHQETEPNLVEDYMDISVIFKRTGSCWLMLFMNVQECQFSSGPKKIELRIGESSAFFTYVKSNMPRDSSPRIVNVDDSAAQNVRMEEKCQPCCQQVVSDTRIHENGEAWENYSQGEDFRSSSSVPDSLSMERSSTPPTDFPQNRNFKDEKFFQPQMPPTRNEPPQATYQYYMSGAMNQVMLPSSSAQMYQKNLHELQNHSMLPQYNHLPQCVPHVNGMASFPYYPINMCLQPGQVSANSWPSYGNSPSTEVKMNKVDRREAALIKFRQKRKERCFDKKIRYVNRKRLAERRPRVRGQFVRKVNGVNVDLNGQPSSVDYDEDEDEEEEMASRDSSPDNDTSGN